LVKEYGTDRMAFFNFEPDIGSVAVHAVMPAMRKKEQELVWCIYRGLAAISSPIDVSRDCVLGLSYVSVSFCATTYGEHSIRSCHSRAWRTRCRALLCLLDLEHGPNDCCRIKVRTSRIRPVVDSWRTLPLHSSHSACTKHYCIGHAHHINAYNKNRDSIQTLWT
jgi:hypothetical protein